MAKEFSKNVIGIEINEEFIYMSQIDEIEDTFTLTNCKQLNMPPRSINDGLLNDPDLIAEQILSSLEDSEFTASNVVISLNTNFFIKRTLITKLKENHELQLEVDNKCQFSSIFLNKDVQASFQKFSLETLGDLIFVNLSENPQTLKQYLGSFFQPLKLISQNLKKFFCLEREKLEETLAKI